MKSAESLDSEEALAGTTGLPQEQVSASPPPTAARPLPASRDGALTPADDIEVLYVEHRRLLLYIAVRKFRVPDADAENLIQEVFLSFLQSAGKVLNVRAWLVAAMCNASRHYWRVQGRTEALPEDFADRADVRSMRVADQFATELTVRQALDYLQPKCQQTLRLHYFDGRSSTEIARELETTTRYAEKLIHNCLKRVREIYVKITAVQK